MNLSQLKSAFKKQGCQKIYAKTLSPNDNSKNQVYLGGSFDILNIFPLSDIIADSSGDWKRDRFKASVDFSWLQNDLFLSSTDQGKIIGHVSSHDSDLTKEFNNLRNQEELGVFKIISVSRQIANNKKELLKELTRINDLGWIDSKRLDNL